MLRSHFGSSFPSSVLVGSWPTVFVTCVVPCPHPFALLQPSRKAVSQFRLHQCMCLFLAFHVCAAAAFWHSFGDSSLPLPIYFDLKVGMSCNNMDAFESHLAFSRRAVWGSIFNPIYVVRPPISIPGSSLPLVPRPCGVIAVASPEHEAEEDSPDKHEVLRVFRAKRTVTG